MYVRRLHCQYYHIMSSLPTSGTLASKHRVYDDLEVSKFNMKPPKHQDL
jgi:hypothetical protein